jgi:hypothetical protein
MTHYVSSRWYGTCCHVSGVPWLIITGSGLDDWIYWRLLCTVSLNYKKCSAIADFTHFPVHRCTRTKGSQSPAVVSWQRISTQKLSLQITMKVSCHFFFNHLELPTRPISPILILMSLLYSVLVVPLVTSNCIPYIVSARTTHHRKHRLPSCRNVLPLSCLAASARIAWKKNTSSSFRNRIYWSVSQHR